MSYMPLMQMNILKIVHFILKVFIFINFMYGKTEEQALWFLWSLIDLGFIYSFDFIF